MNFSKDVERILNAAAVYAGKLHHEYITPEHLLLMMLEDSIFKDALVRCGGNAAKLKAGLSLYLKDNMEIVEKDKIQVSYGVKRVLSMASEKARSSERKEVTFVHLVYSILNMEESYGAYLLQEQRVDAVSFIANLSVPEEEETESVYSGYLVCMNDEVDHNNPLIGREEELKRTMQVLCRKQKNNPLHLGEPGVGKTAIAYGLARRIKEGSVPEKLKDANVYALDLGSLIAGTQFRGDFEKRLKKIMKELEKENAILYIDEIHNLVGAGAVNGGSMDASNLLKPYLNSGKIRFIGATTYEEYKRHFAKDKGLVRRFQNIEIKEPTVEECTEILNGLKKYYEAFHKVRYQKDVLSYAVSLSDKYINERFLPDKAIDLMDEAGAYLALYPKPQKVQTVDKKLMEEVLSHICGVPAKTVETEEKKQLFLIEKQLKKRVFGQSEAVEQLANAVKLSKAGLLEEERPISNLLFVGPTGVGKTELAKATADTLGIHLIRFDMSEYAEKHTVAKLIGSPAGYVGYEDGGLLTEAVRKHPNCVLLLDEIEKAHSDIYNVLLQVMDYATLTDNQGRKADFRNVILIMTSNVGADKAGKAGIGFGGKELNEDGVLSETKKIFQPEFRNRLDRIIIFRPLDRAMADKIVEKQFAKLVDKVATKGVLLTLTKAGKNYILEKGFSREYGAREIERVINQELKPLLVDEMLFGKLKRGGNCLVDYANQSLYISTSL